MRKRAISILLIITVLSGLVYGCTDSRVSSTIEQIDYNPEEEAAKAIEQYNLGEIPEADKDFQIEVGYNNCDHMVCSIIGDQAGIYEALGLNVNITQTNNTNIAQAMSTNQMHAGYMGLSGAVNAFNEGAPLFMAAANHLGGSRYLVVRNDIESPQDLIGQPMAITADPMNNPEWLQWCRELDIPPEAENYEIIEMGMADGPLGLQTGDIAAFTTWDPYASQVEIDGLGKIVAIGWGTDSSEEITGQDDWGMCCIFAMNSNFREEHPELAERLLVAQVLSVKYMHEHPYNAGMMFADGFGTTPEVGLMTIYMKTIAEGRTITWEFSEQNLINYQERYIDEGVDEEYIPDLENIEGFMSGNMVDELGIESFEDYAETSGLDTNFPVGMEFKDWLHKAKAIDGVENDMAEDLDIPDIYEEQGY